MVRKLSLLAALAAGVLVTGGVATRQARTAEKSAKSAGYVHSVIFYLKKDAGADAAESVIADAHELLSKIPSVRALKAGPPSTETQEKVAVKDFSVGLLVLFDDYGGVEQYLKHPQHDEFVKRHREHFEKVLVYDFVDQGK
jgi:hypothetical protein